MRRLQNHAGLTLLECLVVVVILSILMALILPAVQSSRQAARRLHCENNLHQLAIAMHAFHDLHNQLPSQFNSDRLEFPLIEWDLFHFHSWRTKLLPQLEQTSLYNSIDWRRLATSVDNQGIALTVVPSLVCPEGADAATSLGTGLRHDLTSGSYLVSRSDYDAAVGVQNLPDSLVAGTSTLGTQFVRWGIWGTGDFSPAQIAGSKLLAYRPGRFARATDGLSQTLAILERGGRPIDLLQGRPNRTRDNPNAEYPGQVGWSCSNTFAWMIHVHEQGVNVSNTNGIYSLHPGGAHVAMADGSVRFLDQSTDYSAILRLYTPDGSD